MKKTVTITLGIEDDPQYLGYVMTILREGLGTVYTRDEFEKAELEGTLLVSKEGEAADEVKKLPEYVAFMQTLSKSS